MDWRRTDDPYRIWVSEIMLQQTTVRSVTPYYRRFIGTFPDVASLAAAPLEKVLKAWEGLGYYARARNLHKSAGIVVSERGGSLPDEIEGLMALPGIGRSTAGAIAAIAFRRDVPILDANVKRVVGRLDGLRGDIRRSGLEKSLWEGSARLVRKGTGRETALALMDLGATVCTPRGPDCEACPLSRFCTAYGTGTQEEVPGTPRRTRVPRKEMVAAVIKDRGGRLLIVQRPYRGLLGGLWEFPGGLRGDGETLPAALVRRVKEEAGLVVAVGDRIGSQDHAFSHFRITLHVYRCRKTGGCLRKGREWRWVRPEDLQDFAFPAAHRKLIGRCRI